MDKKTADSIVERISSKMTKLLEEEDKGGQVGKFYVKVVLKDTGTAVISKLSVTNAVRYKKQEGNEHVVYLDLMDNTDFGFRVAGDSGHLADILNISESELEGMDITEK